MDGSLYGCVFVCVCVCVCVCVSGTYELDAAKHVPIAPCVLGDKDTSQYYNLPLQKDALPKTGWRSSYDTGITPASSFPPVHRGLPFIHLCFYIYIYLPIYIYIYLSIYLYLRT